MSVLQQILEKKRARLSHARSRVTYEELRSRVRDMRAPRDFRSALTRNGGPIRFIAELKKASPSRGLIRPDFDYRSIARIYESHGANAISVLTEEDFFQGALQYLDDVHSTVSLPLLRKDFLFDPYQIYEARVFHADAVLLIAAMLEKNQAADLLHLAADLGMAVLFEVHDREELDMAIDLSAPIIGINNRNLKTLTTDLATTFQMAEDIPAGRLIVSESGIHNREDVLKLEKTGIDALLIGTALMETADVGARLDELRGKS